MRERKDFLVAKLKEVSVQELEELLQVTADDIRVRWANGLAWNRPHLYVHSL